MIAPVVRDHKTYGESIQKKAKKIKNLELIDFVIPAEIHDFYMKAKVYVLSSELEGFSNTMAEAMQSRCPVLSYNVNPDNILHDHQFGLCAEKDMDKFYQDFEVLNSNEELRGEKGVNGMEYINTFHDKETIINQFKELLSTV